jgi:hypothetical protein
MKSPLATRVVTAMVLVGAVASAAAQGRPDSDENVPLQIQIVIARFQGEKRVSSLPYSLSMNSSIGSKANVRMNAETAVPATLYTQLADADNKTKPQPLTSYTYRTIGTSIDVQAVAATVGRFGLSVTVSESGLQPAETGAQFNVPSNRTYQSSNTVQLRDGETAQFTAATDRLTGEVVRVEVTLRVLK